MSKQSISSPLTNCENMARECFKNSFKKCYSVFESNPAHKREKKYVLPHQLDEYNHENTLAADFSAAFASGYSTPSEQEPCHNFINPLLPHQLRKYNHENTLVDDFSAAFDHESRISSESESIKKMKEPLPHQMNAYRREETLFADFSAAFISDDTTSDNVSFHRVQHLPHQSEKYQHENSLVADFSAVLAHSNYSEPSMMLEEKIHLPHLMPPRASDGFSFQLVENYTDTFDESSSCQAEQTIYKSTSQVEEVENNSAASNFKNSLFSDSSVEPINTGEYSIGASFTKLNYTYTLRKSVPETVDSFKYESANRTYSIHLSNSVCNEVPSINCEDVVHVSCLQIENHELPAPETSSGDDQDNKLSSINNIKDVLIDNVKEENALSTSVVHNNDIYGSLRRIFDKDEPRNDCLKLVESEIENNTSRGYVSSNNYNLVLHDNPNEVTGRKPEDTTDEHFEDVTSDAGLLVQESHTPSMNVSGITNEESGNKSKYMVLNAGIEDVQVNEPEDTNAEHFNDVARDAGFNYEGSRVLSINESSRNKSKDEELDDGLNDVQENHTPSLNEFENRNERHASKNNSGDIVLDDGSNDVALSINKSGDINEWSGNKSKDVALDDNIKYVNESEDIGNGHFKDVARDTVFNDEGSNVLSINKSSGINEASENKSKDEALDDSLNDVRESHTLSLNEIVNEGAKNKSKDVALSVGIEYVQENELEDTNDEHVDDVLRNVGFNDEGSHIMSINEGYKNKFKNEALDDDLTGVQKMNTPPLNESRNRNEEHVYENNSGDIALDDGPNDVALSINKLGDINDGSGNKSKEVARDDGIEDVKGNEPEDTTDGYFEDLARDTVSNDERSKALVINESRDINEGSRNKFKDEALDDSLNGVQESHTLSLDEIVNEGNKNKSKDAALNDGIEDVQENELEDTNDEHFDDVARDAGFNDEGSHIMSINEGSRNKSRNEALQDRNTPPLNESRNRNEEHASENKSGDIVLDYDLNDVALSVNKSKYTNGRHESGINSKNVASGDDINGNEESPPPSSAIAITTSKKNLFAKENTRSVSQNDCSEGSHASSPTQLTNCDKSKSDFNSLYPNNSSRNRTSNINTASDFATLVKTSVTSTQVSEQNNFAEFLFNLSESTETSPSSRHIDVEPVAARRKKITRKRSGRLLDLEDDDTEPLPKKPSFLKFDAYEGPEFYKLLIEKMEPKYAIKTNKEAVAVAKYISETVHQVMKEKNRNVYITLINQMKAVLARKQVVRTNWEFYEFCMRRLPCGFKVKAVPSYNLISAPFEPDTLFKAILEE